MRETQRDLGYGIIEHRVYDSDNKLVEIRKTIPPTKSELKVNPVRIWHGVGGGHEN